MSDILATASRLITLYGFETLYEQSSRHVGIIISDIFDVILTSSMSDFYVILLFWATKSVIKCVETLWFLHRICDIIGSTKFNLHHYVIMKLYPRGNQKSKLRVLCVMIGSTNLPSLICIITSLWDFTLEVTKNQSYDEGHELQQRSRVTTKVTSYDNEGHELRIWSWVTTTKAWVTNMVASYDRGHELRIRSRIKTRVTS